MEYRLFMAVISRLAMRVWINEGKEAVKGNDGGTHPGRSRARPATRGRIGEGPP